MYHLPTPYGSCDTAQTRFYQSRSLQGQRSIQGHTDTAHQQPPTNVPTNCGVRPWRVLCFQTIRFQIA